MQTLQQGIKQGSNPVLKYAMELRDAATATALPEPHMCSQFIAGLRPALREKCKVQPDGSPWVVFNALVQFAAAQDAVGGKQTETAAAAVEPSVSHKQMREVAQQAAKSAVAAAFANRGRARGFRGRGASQNLSYESRRLTTVTRMGRVVHPVREP